MQQQQRRDGASVYCRTNKSIAISRGVAHGRELINRAFAFPCCVRAAHRARCLRFKIPRRATDQWRHGNQIKNVKRKIAGHIVVEFLDLNAEYVDCSIL